MRHSLGMEQQLRADILRVAILWCAAVGFTLGMACLVVYQVHRAHQACDERGGTWVPASTVCRGA